MTDEGYIVESEISVEELLKEDVSKEWADLTGHTAGIFKQAIEDKLKKLTHQPFEP